MKLKAIFLLGVVTSVVGVASAGETTFTKNPDDTVTMSVIYEKAEVEEKIATLESQKRSLEDERSAMTALLDEKINALISQIAELRATVE